jgi:hypothetical protein
MKFESIKELNLFINEFDEVDFVSKRDEVEFLELLNKELENYKIKNSFNVNNCLIKLENKGLLDRFCYETTS